eukprot:TRINITY_DN51822_c0_g1_i1.p1 TRINITY_DN51822_c0_g1~~TRINITY_DN51822_c0_g1_i1.p1  ORF type:complete len:259 (+),score=58.61 TRINITY_DN51822_c0_g1_i1:36-812(+)
MSSVAPSPGGYRSVGAPISSYSVAPAPVPYQPGMQQSVSGPTLGVGGAVNGRSRLGSAASINSSPAPSVPYTAGFAGGPPLTARPAASVSYSSEGTLQAEVARRKAAESRVAELEALVARLRSRISTLEGRSPATEKGPRKRPQSNASAKRQAQAVSAQPPEESQDDAIDTAIRTYLEHNPDFPVSIQKVAPNFYVFGDRGTVYVAQRGEHIVVRVGGGYKSLQVFMDERALMVTRDNAAAFRKQVLKNEAARQQMQK